MHHYWSGYWWAGACRYGRKHSRWIDGMPRRVAGRLASAGLDVTVLEQNGEVRQRSCVSSGLTVLPTRWAVGAKPPRCRVATALTRVPACCCFPKSTWKHLAPWACHTATTLRCARWSRPRTACFSATAPASTCSTTSEPCAHSLRSWSRVQVVLYMYFGALLCNKSPHILLVHFFACHLFFHPMLSAHTPLTTHRPSLLTMVEGSQGNARRWACCLYRPQHRPHHRPACCALSPALAQGGVHCRPPGQSPRPVRPFTFTFC